MILSDFEKAVIQEVRILKKGDKIVIEVAGELRVISKNKKKVD